MRLYFQLEDYETDNAIQYCTEMIIGDLISGDLDLPHVDDNELDVIPPEIIKNHKVIRDVMKKVQDFESEKDRIDFIIENHQLMSIIHGMAHEMLKTFHYLDYNDRVMFADDFQHDDESCPDCQEARKLEELSDKKDNEPQANIGKTTKHKKHSIN